MGRGKSQGYHGVLWWACIGVKLTWGRRTRLKMRSSTLQMMIVPRSSMDQEREVCSILGSILAVLHGISMRCYAMPRSCDATLYDDALAPPSGSL